MLGFLSLFSRRRVNLRLYMKVYMTDARAFGVYKVLGALVDFDYWLDCPPRSAHDDQVRLHQRLNELNVRRAQTTAPPIRISIRRCLQSLDRHQSKWGSARPRVVNACTKGNFVAAKIYPPTGFRPAGNDTIQRPRPRKHRPDLKKLDATLKAPSSRMCGAADPGTRAYVAD